MASNRHQARLARQVGELALAVPAVVGHRLTRMALAGPMPGARDRREFSGMVSEKGVAFTHAWASMGWQMLMAQQRLAFACWQAAFMPWLGGGAAGLRRHWEQSAHEVLAAGVAPVHRKAVANARRLARRR